MDKENEQKKAPTQATGTDPVSETEQPEAEVRMTQAEYDRTIRARLERERQKFADYDDLKKAAARLQEIEDANKTAEQRREEELAALQAQLAEMRGQTEKLTLERQEALLRAEVVSRATKANFVDPSDAYRLLNLAEISVKEDGAIEGIEEQLKALAEAKPYLLRGTAETQPLKVSATNPGRSGTVGESDEARRARLFGVGEPPFGRSGGGVVFPQ